MDYQAENSEEDNFKSAQDHNFYSSAPSAPSTPYAPSNVPTSPTKSARKGLFIIVGIVLLLIIAYLLSSYFIGFWPFNVSKGSSIELFEQVFEKLEDIENASYEAIFSFGIMGKEEGMEALEVDYSDVENPAIQRDYQRFLDKKDLRIELSSAFIDLRRYPSTLKQANISIKDPLGTGYLYQSTDNGKGYEITIIFETREAIETIESRPSLTYVINGKQVTFSSDDYYYYSFNPDTMKPAFVRFIENQGEYLSSIPGNLEVSINTSGIFNREQEELTNASFSFGGEMEYEDMTLKLSADFMRVDDVMYFRLNQIPGIFLAFIGAEISSIKEEWIEIKPEDIIDAYSIFSVFKLLRETRGEQEDSIEAMEELEVFFEVALEQELFLGQDNAKKEKLDGKNVFHYELSLNADALPEFYIALTEEFEEEFGDEAFLKFSENTLRYLEAPQTVTVVNYFNKNGKFDLFIEAKTGYPVKMSCEFAFVPKSKVKSLRNKQLVFSIEINLKDINKRIKVDAPKDFITYDEAVMSMSGLSEEEYYLKKQKNNITAIRQALYTFYSMTDTYPDDLSELLITQYNLQDENDLYLSTYQERTLFKVIPTDAYTGMDYEYQKVLTQDYALTYNINLPEYEEGTRLDSSIYGRAYVSATRLYDSYLILPDGLNTADKNGISQEAKKARYIDSDRDGVSDSLEDYIGTNKYNKDTDGDGKSDGYELSKYTNPLGAGNLEYDYSTGYIY